MNLDTGDKYGATSLTEKEGDRKESESAGAKGSSEEHVKVPLARKKKPVVCIVMGMAGSGKTTLLQRLHLYTTEKGIRSYFINLDPAVKQV